MDAPVSKIVMPTWPMQSCGLPMRGRYAFAWNFGRVIFNLGSLDLGILVNTPVSCACGLCMSDRCAWAWNLGPETIDLRAMTLTLQAYSD